MTEAPSGRRKAALLVLAVIFSLAGLIRVFGNESGYTDALFEPDYSIRHAPSDGPLGEAGFRVGDSVISVEGIPVVELGMYSRWPRSLARRPGESITITVEREGEMIEGEVVFREQPSSILRAQMGFLAVLLAFLWTGVGALFTLPGVHSARLTGIGLAAGFSIPWPNMGTWEGVAGHVNIAGEVLLTLLLFRFFLCFPKPKDFARAHLTTILIYAPWVILLGCLATEIIYHPRFYHSFGGYLGLLLFGYLALAIAALVHSWVKIPRMEMGSSGLGWVLAGFGLGLGGILLWVVDALLLQTVDIPGSAWGPVLFGAIPIGMALGVRTAARSGAP